MFRTLFRAGGIACALAAGVTLINSQAARADLAAGYASQSLPVPVEGQFTAHNDQLHYWTASGGYQIYDVASGSTTTIGLPPNGTNSNGYGDAFGVLDKDNNLFYAATVYGSSDSDVYTYDNNAGSWITPGVQGVTMVNAYGAQVHNGQLYVAGLAEPWNGGYGQDNYIYAFDHTAGVNDTARHDTLIEAAGNSSYMSVASNGDIYYGTFSTNTLYRWTASQVASMTDDLYAPDAVDHFLTLSDAADSWALPGGGNGVAVDDAGNVFFAVNNGMDHILGMIDESDPDGYREILTSSDYMDWYGPMSIEGDFLNGGTLYFSPSTYGGTSMLAITAVPEPTTLVLFGIGGVLMLRRRQKCNGRVRKDVDANGSAGVRCASSIRVALPTVVAMLMLSSTVMAGPFSPGKGGDAESSFIDAGIAGFVGAGGEGIAPEDASENYVNPIFKSWASGYAVYDPSDSVGTYGQDGIGSQFADPMLATGEVTGNNMDIVSLGDMDASEISDHLANPQANPLGSLILTFDEAISNGVGADFATFENGFVSNYDTGAGSVSGLMFAELGYVEVSTDGETFARFPSEYYNYLDSGPGFQAYLTQDVSNIYNLAGKHSNAYGESWGTPFDLDDLADNPFVLDGTVDLNEINYVKIVDIPGDGTFKDSQGNSIYDAWVTWGSGGMDFEALGVLNHQDDLKAAQTAKAGSGALGWLDDDNEQLAHVVYEGLTEDTAFNVTHYDDQTVLDTVLDGGRLSAIDTKYKSLLDALYVDDGLGATFDEEGGFSLTIFFDSVFDGNADHLVLMHYDEILEMWEEIDIANVDMDNHVLYSQLITSASPFAIVSIPEPASLMLLGTGVLCLLRRRRLCA